MSEDGKLGKVEDIRIPLEVVLGGTSVRLEDFNSLGEGTILELDRMCGEPALVKASGKVIAQGEVVVIDENYGLRLTKVFEERS